MKKQLLLFITLLLTLTASAQYKKDGTPDMRYRANKNSYENTSIYSDINTGTRYQNGYYKPADDTYVEGHFKTYSNHTNHDNFSTTGNINPYTGEQGTRAKDYSPEAYRYGQGHEIITGPRGGQYYINDQGNKVYVPKRRMD